MYIDRSIILNEAIKNGDEYAKKLLLDNKNEFAGSKENYNDLVNMFTDPDYLYKPETWFKG